MPRLSHQCLLAGAFGFHMQVGCADTVSLLQLHSKVVRTPPTGYQTTGRVTDAVADDLENAGSIESYLRADSDEDALAASRGSLMWTGGGQAEEKRFIWHLHFHKCAGSTIGRMAIANGLKLAPWEPEIHGHLDLGPGNIMSNDAERVVRRLDTLWRHGVRFGSTEHWFPNASTLTEIRSTAPWIKFMTVLRDPVQRSISSYYAHQGGGGRCKEEICPDVATFGEAEANLMTSLLNGFVVQPMAHWSTPEYCRTTASLVTSDSKYYAGALASLSCFDALFILEKFSKPESQQLLEDKLGWTVTSIPPANTGYDGAGSPPAQNQSTIDKLESMNTLDRKLYSWAVKKFARAEAGLAKSTAGQKRKN